MKKLSRLTALLLALVLLMSTGLGAAAASAEMIDTKDAYFEAAKEALHEFINGTKTWDEYWEVASQISNEDFGEFFYSLTEEEQAYMSERMEGLFWDACISYTEVAPFGPPVKVNQESSAAYGLRLMATNDGISTIDDTTGSETTKENGLILSKNAWKKSDGVYTVQLEAYVTGTVTTTTIEKQIPCDIVLVLDTSWSMDHNSFSTGVTRLEALKTAAKNFIEETRKKYNAQDADHRISIVTYDAKAYLKADWTNVDASGETNLKNVINNLRTTMNTQTDDGLIEANTQLTTRYNYSGTNTTRQKVVILFTDGVPGNSNTTFTNDVGVAAINAAKTIKDGGATVYSVAIYPDADPKTTITSTPSGNVNKINAMLHAISSNYPSATARSSYTITYGNGGNNGYYLTAGSPEELNTIFQDISSNIQSGTASMQLGSTTVVKDIVTPQFVIPANAQNITVQTAECATYNETNYTGTWKTAVTATGVTVTPNTKDKSLSVTGFDFTKNYVSTKGRKSETDDSEGTFHGRKLIITFDVTPEPDFLGGNDVFTNTEAGVYAADGTKVELYNRPDVDVPVKAITPTIVDQHIYLSNAADLKAMIGLHGTTNYREYTLAGKTYSVNSINNKYVDIIYTFRDSSGNLIATYTIPRGKTDGDIVYAGNANTAPVLTQDTTYTITCEVFAADDNKASTTSQGTVYVYEPVLTFKDSAEKFNTANSINAASDADYFTGKNFQTGATYWYNSSLKKTDDQITMHGTEPKVKLTYTASGALLKGTTVDALSCVSVNVSTVTLTGDTTGNYFDRTSTVRGWINENGTCTKPDGTALDCNDAHTNMNIVALAANNAPEFIVHVYDVYGKLEIIKKVNQFDFTSGSFEFNVTGPNDYSATHTVEVGSSKEGSEVIENLLPGEYTVQEITKNGYKVESVNPQTTTVIANDKVSVTFENTANSNHNVTVTKVWKDEKNNLDYRPPKITLTLTGSDGQIHTQEFAVDQNKTEAASTATYTFSVPKYDVAGNEIKYTVSEDEVDDYKTEYDQTHKALKVTNEINVGHLMIKKAAVKKDENTADLPDEEFEFKLLLTFENQSLSAPMKTYHTDGTYTAGTIMSGQVLKLKADEYVIIAVEPQHAFFSVEELNKPYFTNDQDNDTVYGNIGAGSVLEVPFTNTYHKRKTGDLTITKNLVDASFTEGTRKFNFNVKLNDTDTFAIQQFKEWAKDNGNLAVAADNSVTVSVTVNAPEAATSDAITSIMKLTGLPVGSYTVTEVFEGSQRDYYAEVENGTSTVDLTTGNKTVTVTNTADLYSAIDVEKIWEDQNNASGQRPTGGIAVTLTGTANGKAVYSSTIENWKAEGDEWTHIWTNVPKKTLDGTAITYTVSEQPVTNYSTTITGDVTKGFTVTNTIERTSMTITKDGNVGADEIFIMKVQTESAGLMEVVIVGNGSVTINNLMVGEEVTVTEDMSWAWRYNAAYAPAQKITLTANAANNKVTVTNTVENKQWIDGNTSAENIFGSTPTKVPSASQNNK